ncbi:J domain-containing protein [Streptomyces sp. NPDC006602]|uniref:J domain-containing protein n=1 Tax=Streptomyces sp. NPDC006602 TaxID=3364751 RepID=UPI0036ADE76F
MPGQRPRRDHYVVLGVQPSASAQQITTAYRRLVRSLHPDTGHGDPAASEDFAEVVTAYDTLRDPERRAAYDAGRDDPADRTRSGNPIPVRVRVTRTRAAPTAQPGANQPDDLDPLDVLALLGDLAGLRYWSRVRARPTLVDPRLAPTTRTSAARILQWMWHTDPWQ